MPLIEIKNLTKKFEGLPPTSGHALINGFDVSKHPTQVKRSIGFVFQDSALGANQNTN